MRSADDLADLFMPGAPGPSQTMRFRQGTIVTFDPVTLSNTVRIGNGVFTNLPLLGAGELTLLVPGAVVGIIAVGDSATTMYITGRTVTPNTPDATSVITLLSQGIVSATVPALESTTSSGSYVDLTTFGPEVTARVGASGKVLVFTTAYMELDVNDANNYGALISYTMSGANVRAAGALSSTARFDTVITPSSGSILSTFDMQATGVTLETGLTPGDTTFTMKYAASGSAGPATAAFFASRNITVIVI